MNNYLEASNNLILRHYSQKWINIILKRYKQKLKFVIPPICEKTLCEVIEEIKGIKITLERDEKKSIVDEGLLMPVRGGFIIKYGTFYENKKRFPNVKIRETICHELAHILFYNCKSLFPRLKNNPPEYLCHDIARQLLLPDQIVKEKFLEKIEPDSDLKHIIEQLSRDFQVAIILMVRRLTEDLSLLKDTMITFWKYRPQKDPLSNKMSRYNGYRPDPKLSSELRELLPKYWRDQVHIEAWDKIISKMATGQTNGLSDSLYVEGKKRRKGKIKSIPFEIQCAPLYDRHYSLNFRWQNNGKPISDILSIKKFNLSILKIGK